MATPNSPLNHVSFHYCNIPMSINIAEVHLAQGQQSQDSRSPNYYTIIASTIGGFLGILQVQNGGSSLSSSEFREVIFIASGINLLGYYLASRAKFWIPRYASHIAILMAELANCSVAFLVSVVLPNSKPWWPVKFIIFLILLSEPFYPTVKILYDKFVQPLFCWRPQFPVPASNLTRIRPLLPLTVMDGAYSTTTPATLYQNATGPAIVVGSSSPFTISGALIAKRGTCMIFSAVLMIFSIGGLRFIQ